MGHWQGEKDGKRGSRTVQVIRSVPKDITLPTSELWVIRLTPVRVSCLWEKSGSFAFTRLVCVPQMRSLENSPPMGAGHLWKVNRGCKA